MTATDHPPLPPLLHELPSFQWEGQANPRVYLRDMTGRRGWGTQEEAPTEDSEVEDWYLFSYHAALAA
jgi:hypothetical protein